MTDKKYSDPSRDLGNTGQGKDDKSPDREKGMGQKDLGSRHGDESSRGTGSSSSDKSTGSDFDRKR